MNAIMPEATINIQTDTSQYTQRLRSAVEEHYRRMDIFRKNRILALREYVGGHYSENASAKDVPVNILSLAVDTYARELAAYNPKVLVTTWYKQLQRTSTELEIALNHLVSEIKFARTLRRIVKEALFSVGIAKVGLEATGELEIGGIYHDVGQPFFDCVDIEDFVLDMSASTFEDVQFVGNRYRIPLEYAKQLYSQYDWTPQDQSHSVINPGGTQRVGSLSSGGAPLENLYRPIVELWDIYCPHNNMLFTFPGSTSDNTLGPPLREVEWERPENGPYHLLSLHEVPGNIMPLSPSMQLYDLHCCANILFRKLQRQGERQKTIGLVNVTGQEDGTKIVNANDGDTYTVLDPNAAKEFSYGGINQQNFAFFLQVKELASYFAGNIETIAGLGPQADTLGQEQLLAATSSKRLQDYQENVYEFTKEIANDLAWYLWEDPLIELPLAKRLEGISKPIPFSWTPERREGDFLDYHLEIEPYSMQPKTPAQRLMLLERMVQQTIAPLLPIIQQQGGTFDIKRFLELYAKYSNMAEMEDIIIFNEETKGPNRQLIDTGGGNAVRQSPMTKRTYERVNRPGATESGKNQVLINALMGNRLQGAQNDVLGRGTS